MNVKAKMYDDYSFNIKLDNEAIELLHQAGKRINITSTELIEGLIISRLIWLNMLDRTIAYNTDKKKDSRYVRLLNMLNIFRR